MNLSEKRYDAEANDEGRFPEGDTSRLQSGKGSISVRGIHYETGTAGTGRYRKRDYP